MQQSRRCRSQVVAIGNEQDGFWYPVAQAPSVAVGPMSIDLRGDRAGVPGTAVLAYLAAENRRFLG